MDSHKKQKVVKQWNCSVGKWEWYLCIDTQVGSRQLHLVGVWIHFMGHFFIGFLWSIISICASEFLSPFVPFIYQDPLLCFHISAKSGFQWVAWKVALASLPLILQSFLVRKVPLTSRMRNMWPLLCFIWARAHPASSLQPVLLIFWSFCPHGMNSSCLPLPAVQSTLSSFRLGCLNFSGSFACLQMLVLVLSVILQISFASGCFCSGMCVNWAS